MVCSISVLYAQEKTVEQGRSYFSTYVSLRVGNPYAKNGWSFLVTGSDSVKDKKVLNRLLKNCEHSLTVKYRKESGRYQYCWTEYKQYNGMTLQAELSRISKAALKNRLTFDDFGITHPNTQVYWASTIQYPYMMESKILLKGQVKDRYFSGIPYANVKVMGTAVGTVADEYGMFELNVPSGCLSDSICISAPGYQPAYRIASTQNMLVAQLEDQSAWGQEDWIDPIGTADDAYIIKRSKGKLEVRPQFNEAGGQLAKLVDFRHPALLRKVSLYMKLGQSSGTKLRLRIYQYDSITALPGNEITRESIIIEPNYSKGWICFDIEAYQITVVSQVVLAVEWLDNSYANVIVNANELTSKSAQAYIKLGSGYDWSTDYTFDWSIHCEVGKSVQKVP